MVSDNDASLGCGCVFVTGAMCVAALLVCATVAACRWVLA